MKLNDAKKGSSQKYLPMILSLAVVAVATVGAACTDKLTEQTVKAQSPAVKTVSLESKTAPISVQPDVKAADKIAVKQANAPLKFRSRDYAVSFEYPWQYSIANAKTISEMESLQPKGYDNEDQITLTRVDLPKGFYPDSDFDSGYFTLSLNPEIEEDGCKAVLGTGLQTANVNGTDFVWMETEQVGKGSSSKVRSYVTYKNDVCYEFELGVKTKNEKGLAREVNPDQVMRRLEAMLKTVSFK
jgi:hypothetical protein